MASSSDDSNQLEPSHRYSPAPRQSPVIEAKPETVSVRAGSSVLTDIGESVITRRAEYIRHSTDEQMIWQESPSLALLVPRFLRYAILFAIVLIACSAARNFIAANPWVQEPLERAGIHATIEPRPSEPAHKARRSRAGHRAAAEPPADADSTDGAASAAIPEAPVQHTEPGLSVDSILLMAKFFFGGLFTLLLLAYLLKLNTTKYCASSQRLIVEEGALHSVNRPYELHQLGDAVIMKPLLLRIFGVSNLVITRPGIKLYGLRNADYVRDILRQGGQLEAQRTDKIRYR